MQAMTTRPTVSRDERPAKDVEILRRWAEPNIARICQLRRDGFTEEAAAEYDVLERREAALLDLEAERGLSETEDEELARISQQLAEMHRQATCEHDDTETEYRRTGGHDDAEQVLVCTECGKEWTDPDQAREDGALDAPVKEVTVPIADKWYGLLPRKATVKLYWRCPKCGGPRGELENRFSYDGRYRIVVDGWDNPCGHIDKYSDVRREALQNGLNNAKAETGHQEQEYRPVPTEAALERDELREERDALLEALEEISEATADRDEVTLSGYAACVRLLEKIDVIAFDAIRKVEGREAEVAS